MIIYIYKISNDGEICHECIKAITFNFYMIHKKIRVSIVNSVLTEPVSGTVRPHYIRPGISIFILVNKKV